MFAVHVVCIGNEIVQEAAKTLMRYRNLASNWRNNLKRMASEFSQSRQAPNNQF